MPKLKLKGEKNRCHHHTRGGGSILNTENTENCYFFFPSNYSVFMPNE